MKVDPALRRKPTFEELINQISEDKTTIKLPNRLFLHFWDSPVYQQIVHSHKELDIHQTTVHHHNVREHEAVQMASSAGVTKEEIMEAIHARSTRTRWR